MPHEPGNLSPAAQHPCAKQSETLCGFDPSTEESGTARASLAGQWPPFSKTLLENIKWGAVEEDAQGRSLASTTPTHTALPLVPCRVVPVDTLIPVPSRAGVTGEGAAAGEAFGAGEAKYRVRGYAVAARKGSPFQAEERQAGRNVYPRQVHTASFCWGQEKPQPPGLPLVPCPYMAVLI